MLTLLTGADVFAPESLGPRDVLVCAGKVIEVAPSIDRGRLPASTEVVDLRGSTLTPGLVDAHVHLTGGGGESGPSTRVPPIALTALTTAGVTTCVGVLGTDTVTRTMESLVARTLGLREEGISAYCWTGGYEVPPRTLTGSVRRDIVFVDPIVGVGETAISDHRSSQPTFDEIVRLAADCHVAGLMSGKAGILHLHLGDGARGLDLVRRALRETEIPARTFHPTHVNRNARLWEEAKAIAAEGVVVDVTAFPPDDDDPALPAESAIAAFLDAGLPKGRITCSSDGAGCLPTFDAEGRLVAMDVGRPSELLRTLRALFDMGRPLADVLPVFTRNPADVLRLAAKGRIGPGADADLLVFGSGLRLDAVMARGKWMVRSGAPCVTGVFEAKKPRASDPMRVRGEST